MNTLSKVSDITAAVLAEYLRIAETTQDEQAYLTTIIEIAKSFMSSYTGRTVAELDNFKDFIIVCLVLCQDMYDNRALYVDSRELNKVIETILGMHSINLLPMERTVSADDSAIVGTGKVGMMVVA